MKKTRLALLIILLAFTACRNTAANPQPTPEARSASRPDPTATTAPATPAHTPTPTSVVPDLVASQTYTHTTQRFQIDYPDNWQPTERADGVIFIDPGDQAGYSVFFNDPGETYSAKQLNQYLVTFVAQNFDTKNSDFAVISQETQPDGTVVAQFTLTDPKLGPTIYEIRVSQQDSLVFVLMMSVTQTQWDISADRLHKLADTLTPLDTSPLAESEPTAEPPEWVLIGPSGNEFAFFYPSDWEILAQEENTVAVTMPDTDIIFEAGVFAWPGSDNDPAAAKKAAQAFVTSLDKKYEQLQSFPPVEFPLHTFTGSTIDFLYTTKSGQSIAGSVITAANKGKMYRVVFLAPAEYYQGALAWFNPMYKSFKTLSPEELLVEPE